MLKWNISEFASLKPKDIHDLYQLRGQVFAVEQKCIYLDQDGRDLIAWHLLGRETKTGDLAAYARIMLPTEGEGVASFGRVAVATAYRGLGLGRELVAKIMRFIAMRDLQSALSIEISARTYLVNFYESFGFQCISEPYLEEGIPHVRMRASTKVVHV